MIIELFGERLFLSHGLPASYRQASINTPFQAMFFPEVDDVHDTGRLGPLGRSVGAPEDSTLQCSATLGVW